MVLRQRILVAALLLPASAGLAQVPLRRPDTLALAAPQAAPMSWFEMLFGADAPEATLTREERGVAGDAISKNWNRAELTKIEDFEPYSVRIMVDIGTDGRVETVSPHTPSTPLGAYAIAYQAALRAVMTTDENGGIPLPMSKFPVGVTLVLRFDPSSGEIRLS